MTYASTSIDRRADYYARCAELIAADPLDFYTRAERGRRFQASRIKSYEPRPQQSTSVPVALSEGVAWLTDARAISPRQADAEQHFRVGILAA